LTAGLPPEQVRVDSAAKATVSQKILDCIKKASLVKENLYFIINKGAMNKYAPNIFGLDQFDFNYFFELLSL
jgi:hypothetical protein